MLHLCDHRRGIPLFAHTRGRNAFSKKVAAVIHKADFRHGVVALAFSQTQRSSHIAAGPSSSYLAVVFLLVCFLPELPLRVQRRVWIEGGLCYWQQHEEEEGGTPHPGEAKGQG